MKLNLSAYANLNICVAVSGGKDSMALLHYLFAHGKDYGIALCAVNCDHGIRGEASKKDSAFVAKWCAEHGVPLASFVRSAGELHSESSARAWRIECYRRALIGTGADAIATAHHLDDNAETVLFRLARGSSLSGLTGIRDYEDGGLKIVRPLLSCTREEIDGYIRANGVPFVEDETNFEDNYTRNKIRHNVLPALESAVAGASKSIYRFSRTAYEDEEFFNAVIAEKKLVNGIYGGVEVRFCEQKPLFRRATLKALCLLCGSIKDYTLEHLETLYALQYAKTGKKFNFLGVTAYKEDSRIVFCKQNATLDDEIDFNGFICGKSGIFGGQPLKIVRNCAEIECGFAGKVLKFDLTAIPETAVIRFMREGDRFTKFGGGTKSLGDYFTDKKIPVRLRKTILLIADGNEILAVCGVEISDKIKVTDSTENVAYIACNLKI